MPATSLSDIRPDDIVDARGFERVEGFPSITPELADVLNDARVNLTAHIIGTDPDFAEITHAARVQRGKTEKPADSRYEDQRIDYIRLLKAQGVSEAVASVQFDSDLTEITGRLNAIAVKGAGVIPPSTRVTPDEVDAALTTLGKISAGTASLGGTEEALDRASARLIEIKRALDHTQGGNRSRAG